MRLVSAAITEDGPRARPSAPACCCAGAALDGPAPSPPGVTRAMPIASRLGPSSLPRSPSSLSLPSDRPLRVERGVRSWLQG
jgi:hypothetical protein